MPAADRADSLATWLAANGNYLEAGVAWVRLLLSRQAGQGVSDRDLAAQADRMAEAERTAPSPPALVFLAEQLELSDFERNVLLLCVAVEVDTRLARLCAVAQDDPGSPYPTFALALVLFDDPAWEALAPDRPLRYWRLVEPAVGNVPLAAAALRAAERVVHHAKGLMGQLDERLSALLIPAGDEPGAELAPTQLGVAGTAADVIRQGAASGRLPVVQLFGADRGTTRAVVRAAAAELGLRLELLPAALLPSQPDELDTLARLWQREALLLPLALHLDGRDLEAAAATEVRARLSLLLARSGGVLFLEADTPWPDVGDRPNVVLDVPSATPAEQEDAWADGLAGDNTGELAGLLAGQFDLSNAEIRAVAAQDRLEPAVADRADRLWQACVMRTRPRIDRLAQRMAPRSVTWDDLVLPQPELGLLHQIVAQMAQRHTVHERWGFRERLGRGLGISVLFAGDSGTGKTLAAEVIAAELRLNLYRIDLAQVVSKYIGETEKNLGRLFDAADRGGAVLLFDEADALFGRRSEVRDSHDRYANIEINYLLQRMETHRGLAVLATNMKSALDDAFLRRLRFVVDFPYPGPAERAAIWARAFPAGTPVAGLDLARLAQLDLSGGGIAAVALNAAFLAAAGPGEVTMAAVLEAVRAEFAKRGRSDEVPHLEAMVGAAP